MNITQEMNDWQQLRDQQALKELDEAIHNNPCDNCSMKYIDESYCLTCDINYE